MDKMEMEVEMLPLNLENMLKNEAVYSDLEKMFQEAELPPHMYLKLVICAKKNGMSDKDLFMREKEEYIPFDSLAYGEVEDSTEDM